MRLYIEYRGDAIEVPRGETLVGRDVGCALRFNDPSVSRRHLRFIRRHDDAFVEDLSSSNGTLLNGRLVKAPVRLRDGDVILVGSRVLVMRVMASDDVELPVTLHPENDVDQDAGTEIDLTGRAPTGTMRRVPEPPAVDQRCPRCGAGVADQDATCASCGYAWGNFRPSTPTAPPPFATPTPLGSRKHDRLATTLRLIYVSSDLEVEAVTRNLSHSGVFVNTQILEPIGTECKLTLLIDGGPALEVSGIVRRVVDKANEGVGLGIELVGLTDQDHHWIDVVLARDEADDQGILAME